MAEEVKPPEGQETVKTVEQVMAELKVEREAREKAEKQVKDKDEFIGRQSTEIGELRKKTTPEPKPEPQDKDGLIEEIYQDLRTEGLDEETARYNAKILAKSGVKIIDKRLNERMMGEVVDLVDEAMDEGKIDKKVYQENEEEILSEFKARKLAATPRKTYKILRDCYDIVTRRRAETLRIEKDKEDAGKRDKNIAETGQPAGGGKQVASDEDKQTIADIRNAGTKRNSAFF